MHDPACELLLNLARGWVRAPLAMQGMVKACFDAMSNHVSKKRMKMGALWHRRPIHIRARRLCRYNTLHGCWTVWSHKIHPQIPDEC